jgi:mRNA-degrading endonuclease RelE of RelBE toxin-antitoxin system
MTPRQIEELHAGDVIWTRGQIILGEGIFVLHKPKKCVFKYTFRFKDGGRRIMVDMTTDEGRIITTRIKYSDVALDEESAKRGWINRRKSLIERLVGIQDEIRLSLQEDE